jgi:tetratricopeptide (TPR) repeat protein
LTARHRSIHPQLAREAGNSLAALLLSRGQSEPAEDRIYDTLASAQDTGSAVSEIHSRLLLGEAALAREAVEEAEGWGRQALGLARAERSPHLEAAACMLLSDAAIARQSGAQAHQWAHSAMELLGQEGSPGDRARCHYLMGVASVLNGDPNMGARFLEEAGKLFGSVGQVEREQDMKGLAQEARRLVEEARKRSRDRGRALEAADGVGEPAFRALLDASDAMINRELYDEALPLAERAMTAAERLGETGAIAEATQNLGRALIYQGRCEEARGCLERARTLYGQCDDPEGVAMSAHQLARALQSLGDYPGALACLKQAERHFAATDDWVALASCLAQQGFLSRHTGDFRQAVHRFAAGYSIALSRQPRLAGRIVTDLARTLDQMGEGPFAAAWREATRGQEPPIEWLRGVLRQIGPES